MASQFTKQQASTSALLEFPEVNAYIDDKETVYRDYVDIGDWLVLAMLATSLLGLFFSVVALSKRGHQTASAAAATAAA